MSTPAFRTPQRAHFLESSAVHSGWTLGGGVEFKIAPKFSLGLEFMHTDLGRSNDINGASTLGTAENYGVAARSNSFMASSIISSAAAQYRTWATSIGGPRQFSARCWGTISAISAISFLTMMSPNELEFSATMTNAPGPPMTLLR